MCSKGTWPRTHAGHRDGPALQKHNSGQQPTAWAPGLECLSCVPTLLGGHTDPGLAEPVFESHLSLGQLGELSRVPRRLRSWFPHLPGGSNSTGLARLIPGLKEMRCGRHLGPNSSAWALLPHRL